ncbi:MAG: hypothetical protein E7667_03165 [Ruminococcaceae bacterium]|nr:hypothetical protein [Oscillospiraceae bacterium]
MKEFHENLYFAAMDAERFGEVLLFRTNAGNPCVGENLFDLIGIDGSERLFVLKNLSSGGEAPLIILSDSHVVAVYRNMFYSMGICCFAEFDCDREMLCSMLGCGMLGECIMSDKALAICRDISDFDETARAGAYFSVMLLNRKLSFFGDMLEPDRMADVASAICSDMECETYGDALYAPLDFSQRGMIFSNAVYAVAVLSMCFVSKIISTDRKLKFTLRQGGYFIGISAMCEAFSAEAQKVIDNLVAFALRKGVYINISQNGDQICTEISPFYEDIGLRGVKNPLIIDKSITNTEHWKGQLCLNTEEEE